jgi:cytochrome c peroxidase
MKKWIIVCCLFVGIVLFACRAKSKEPAHTIAFIEYIKDIDVLQSEVTKLVDLLSAKADGRQLQSQFLAARAAYKKTEWLVEYYNPYTAKSINGPAIPEVETDEKSKIIAPEGFQVIEEMLFPVYDRNNHKPLLQQIKILQSNVGRLKYVAYVIQTTDAHIFDAIRLQMFRILALGISGFDSPIANNSTAEASASLQCLSKVFLLYASQLENRNAPLTGVLKDLFNHSVSWLSKQKDFNSLDRMFLIRQYLNPLSKNLLAAQKQLDIPVFTEPRFLKANAETLFSRDIFNPDFYADGTNSNSPDKVALGKRLFNDGVLSESGSRSCATCHQPSKAFTDGLKTSLAISGKNLLRNSPTLINAALQPSLFYDMRVNYLEDQAKDVISNKDEMHGSFRNVLGRINKDKRYKALFSKIYRNETISEVVLKNAIASYVRSLTGLNSRFDKYMNGEETAMNAMEITGFNLFMGKAKCGTCHFVPLFNGNNPPAYTKTDAEVIGVPATTDTLRPTLDPDEGKYNLYKINIHRFAFKTPGLRNIALTTPYMHNGVYKTLDEVVDFYNRGGGSGLGFKMDNQTLSKEALNLSNNEKRALISFLNTLNSVKNGESYY